VALYNKVGDLDEYITFTYFGFFSRPFFLWPPCVADADIIFLPCDFFLSIFFIPRLISSGLRLDAYHTSTHGVALVRIYIAGLKCAASGSLEIQDAKMMQKIAICAPSHNFVGLRLRN